MFKAHEPAALNELSEPLRRAAGSSRMLPAVLGFTDYCAEECCIGAAPVHAADNAHRIELDCELGRNSASVFKRVGVGLTPNCSSRSARILHRADQNAPLISSDDAKVNSACFSTPGGRKPGNEWSRGLAATFMSEAPGIRCIRPVRTSSNPSPTKFFRLFS